MKHAAVFALAALATMSPLTLSAQPRLEVVGGATLDFGTILRGDVIDRKISVRNTGTEALVISHVEPSCGCTGAVVSGDRIAPGDTGTIEITFNSRNFSGPVEKSVYIESNAPGSPRTAVHFRVTVTDEVTISPRELLFKDAEVDRKSELTLSVKNDGKEDLTLTGYRTQQPLPGFSLTLPKSVLRPSETVQIPVTFTPKEAKPVLYDQLFITTSNPRRPELYIPVYGNVKSASPEEHDAH